MYSSHRRGDKFTRRPARAGRHQRSPSTLHAHSSGGPVSHRSSRADLSLSKAYCSKPGQTGVKFTYKLTASQKKGQQSLQDNKKFSSVNSLFGSVPHYEFFRIYVCPHFYGGVFLFSVFILNEHGHCGLLACLLVHI